MKEPLKKYLNLSEEEQNILYNQFLQEPDEFYEKADIDLLKESLKKSAKERFLTMTRLMKTGMMLTNAKITHKPFPLKKNP